MNAFVLRLLPVFWLLTHGLQAQLPVRPAPRFPAPQGFFLTDSIEIGRPFQYALIYRHAPTTEVLFPDTTRDFAPYLVQKIAVFATQTVGSGWQAVSRDSAVYTLVSFETDSVQRLRVPVRLLHATDCTALLTQPDTVFLRSRLTPSRADSAGPQALTLATATELAPLPQTFNYPVLGLGLLAVGLLVGLFWLLFGRIIRRQVRVYQLNRRHLRFLREHNRLSRSINAHSAAETAKQAVVMWKTYLEKLERQPYASLTTSELAGQINDERVMNALRETDRMMYGGAFSDQSQPALRMLGDMATRTYHRCRADLQKPGGRPVGRAAESSRAESSSFSES